MTDPSQNKDLFGRTTEIGYTVQATGEATQSGPMLSGDVTVTYDAATQSYRVIGTSQPSMVFGPSNRTADSNATFTVYQTTTGNKTDRLRLFNPGSGNPVLALTYASYGSWRVTTQASASTINTDIYFVYGIRATDMPRTGTGTYQTILDGTFAGVGGVYTLSGTSSFIADFGANSFLFTTSPIGTNQANGAVKSFGNLTINGLINGTSFSGSTVAGGAYQMSLNGGFYGPAAAEMAGAFHLTGPDGQGAGVVVGRKN